MAGSENVYNIVQLGRQAGTFDAPGAAVPATFKYPVTEPVNFELDRGSQYPAEDYGRNVRNHTSRGYHGVRAASGPLSSEVRFEDLMDILEMCYAGDVSPTPLGGGLYSWLDKFEAGAPTLVPYTIETGNIDADEAQHQAQSALINELGLTFADLTAPGASPWTLSADVQAFDRAIAAVTPGLVARPNLKTVQGHLTRIYFGGIGDTFSALDELVASLVGFSQTATRNLTRRPYGGSSDLPVGFGFTDLSTASADVKIRVSETAKTTLHDSWNAPGADLGEQRVRIEAEGSGGRKLTIDARAGITAFPYDERDGERVYSCHLEYVDDEDLDANHAITVVNGISSLTSGSGS